MVVEYALRNVDTPIGVARYMLLPPETLPDGLAGALPTQDELSPGRPLWQVPIRLDNARLLALLGAEPATSMGQAEATLRGLGCLPPALAGYQAADQRHWPERGSMRGHSVGCYVDNARGEQAKNTARL